jgi:hypothetical protein
MMEQQNDRGHEKVALKNSSLKTEKSDHELFGLPYDKEEFNKESSKIKEVPNGYDPVGDLSLYEEILNSPMFYVPDDVGDPGQPDMSYPDTDSLGTPDMKDKEPGSDKDNLKSGSSTDDFIYHKGLPKENNPTMLDEPSGPVDQQTPTTDPDHISPSLAKEGSMNNVDLEKASEEVAQAVVDKLMTKLAKTPAEAYFKLYAYVHGFREIPDGFTQMAVDWTKGYLNTLSDAERSELEGKARVKYEQAINLQRKEVSDKMANEKVIADKEKGYPLKKTEGPNDPESLPGKAPAGYDEFHQQKPPSEGVPETKNPSSKENDEAAFPKDHSRKDYSPKGHVPEEGIPESKTPAYKENDAETFPAKADGGLSLKVTPTNQPPENMRHNPYIRQEREGKELGPRAPWERKSQMKKSEKSESEHRPEPTPGMEFLYHSEDQHITGLESTAQEAELYYRRYVKHGQDKDLDSQSNRFRAERITMGEINHCEACDDENKEYASAVFAYSYGQMRHSLSRAMRQFTDKDTEPDMVRYHEVTALKADLMGAETMQYISNAVAEMEIQFAAYGGNDKKKDPDDNEDDPSENAKKKDPDAEDKKDKGKDEDTEKSSKSESDGGDKEMKAEDVKAATEIATGLLKAKLISEDKLAETISTVAALDPASRQAWANLTKTVAGTPEEPEKAEVKEEAKTSENISLSVLTARKNMVGSGYKENAGTEKGGSRKAPVGAVLGMFSRPKTNSLF